jgi:hypothetical protein
MDTQGNQITNNIIKSLSELRDCDKKRVADFIDILLTIYKEKRAPAYTKDKNIIYLRK